MRQRLLFLFFFSVLLYSSHAQEIAVLKYQGGGDWYANPTALPNLIDFCNREIQTSISEKPAVVEVGSPLLFDYPMVFMTGHGNVFFSDTDAANLRKYLTAGGFLHVSDNYGIDPYLRKEMKKVFPEAEFREIPNDHPIYSAHYQFDQLPKIHEHDGKPAKGYGLFIEGRLVVFYDMESDLSDGWESPAVHNDPPEVREKALKMGANLLTYAFKN